MNRPFRRVVSLAAALITTMIAAACGLGEGSIDALSAAGDASAMTSDATSDATSATDGNVLTDGGAGAGDSGLGDADAGFVPRYIFANTSTKAYALELNTNALHLLGSVTGCTDAAIDTFDLAQDSNGRLEVLGWKTSGLFWVYAMQADGGCIDLHGGSGSNTGGSSMWVGFQKGATSDTLYSAIDNDTALLSYSANGDFIATVSNVFPGGGATADIACTPTLCYTALTHDRCTGATDNNDCLVSFTNAGANVTNVGDFGKAGIAGIAYDSGFIYGFATDGSIIRISTTAPSVGARVSVTGVSTAALVWAGAASSSANE